MSIGNKITIKIDNQIVTKVEQIKKYRRDKFLKHLIEILKLNCDKNGTD